MKSRRALFGILAGGAAVAATAADACSPARQTCQSFRAGMRNTQAMVRAYVIKSVDASFDRGDGEWTKAAEIKARTTEVITGMVREGQVFEFQARVFDCNGLEFGYLPDKGETVVFWLERASPDDDWSVEGIQPAADYDRWRSRCGLT